MPHIMPARGGKFSIKADYRSPESRLEWIECILISLGAFGLGLGLSLIPQVLLIAPAIYRLVTDAGSRKFEFRHTTIILLTLAGWMALSAIPAVRPFAAWGGAVGTALSGWVVFRAVRTVMIEKKVYKINPGFIFLGSACIGAVYTMRNYISALIRGRGYYRAALAYINPNTAGTIFCVAALVTLGCFHNASRRGKLILIPVMILLISALIATQSRGAFVAFIVGFAVYVLFGGRSRRDTLIKTVALASLILIVVLCLRINPSVSKRYARILSPALNKDRLEIWKTALLMMKDRPVLGVGFNNFIDIYPLYPHPEGSGKSMSMAHNIFLEFGATTGVPGLILFTVIVVLGISKGIKGIIKTGSSSNLPITTLSVFVAVMTHLQFDITADSGNTLPLFFVPYSMLMLLDEWLGLRTGEDDRGEN
ncbi:MAG: O-antigen ligase family protein [Firmicutes bacterium]|nr:O-antigen ligase family protein [Bacillota bacterium]